jgi:uncharacterized membrane protein YkoI
MKMKALTTLGAVVALGATAGGVAYAAGNSRTAASGGSGSSAAPASRLDDGKQYLSQAKIGEQDAIAAAQTRASGALNEVDLEQRDGQLVWNVDVGAHDVKVDAANGNVVAVDADD